MYEIRDLSGSLRENTFILEDDQGVQTIYDVLFTYRSDETGRHYIAYTDRTLDEQGNIQVFASRFDPGDPRRRLSAIETEEEWELVEALLEQLQQAVRQQLEP